MNQGSAAEPSATARYWNLAFRPGKWLLSRFSRLDQSAWPVLWVIGLFAVQAFPATIIRASNLEEGTILAIARGAVEDGHWLTPSIYGERFIEKPVLQSWMAALFGELGGGVTLWSLRIPHLCIFLAGALLVYSLLRSVTGKSAAIFGALCWITMPVVAPKFINAEPDVVLATLLFAAFYVWWRGTSDNRMTFGRWTCVSLLLALAGLTKGPQPIAYFTLGVGAYILLKQRDQIVAFLLANLCAGLIIGGWYALVYQHNDLEAWKSYSRLSNTTSGLTTVRGHLDFIKSLVIEFLPGSILIGPATVIAIQTWRTRALPTRRNDLLLAAVLYSLACTLVLLFWPGKIAARYAMPGTVTLAVVCGLMFEQWRDSHRKVIVSALFVTYLIFFGLLVRGWVVMPLRPQLFEQSRIGGTAISAAIRHRPGPLYVIQGSSELNMLSYVPGPIRTVTLDDLARLQADSMAMLRPDERQALAHKAPALQFVDRAHLAGKQPYVIVEIVPTGSR
jgi:4-amino-4-deoxy-L-arabinose transferase-like glycosyltransferase